MRGQPGERAGLGFAGQFVSNWRQNRSNGGALNHAIRVRPAEFPFPPTVTLEGSVAIAVQALIADCNKGLPDLDENIPTSANNLLTLRKLDIFGFAKRRW